MRVTNNMIIGNLIRNLHAGLRRMERYNEQLSTGKALRVASDDPAAVVKAMRYRSQLVEVEQYLDNINDALSWLNASESALAEAGSVLQRARELALDGANGNKTASDRQAIAQEVEQLIHHLVQVANATVGDRYLFSGLKTDTPAFGDLPPAGEPPYQGDQGLEPPYRGDQGLKKVEISAGVTLEINVLGDEAFEPVFKAMVALRDALMGNQADTIGGEILGDLDAAIDNLLRIRAEVGAKANRLEAAANRLEELTLNVSRVLSETEDVDIAQAIMELKMQENVYRLALASGARIIQPTLMDFLR